MLVSTREHGNNDGPVEFRSYRIVDGVVTEEEVERRARSFLTDEHRLEEQLMAIEVRIPTILRTYTDGEKAVTAEGASLSALIDDLEANHPGIKERLVERRRPAPVRQRLRQRRGRPVHRWARGRAQRRRPGRGPARAVAGG